MSIENAVNEILSSGNFDDMSPSVRDWDVGSRRSFCRDVSNASKIGQNDICYGDVESQVFETLTARQHEQMQHYKAEAERADI